MLRGILRAAEKAENAVFSGLRSAVMQAVQGLQNLTNICFMV